MLTSCIREDLQNIIGAELPWGRFTGKRILVTGAAGFLPAYFVETLLALRASGEGPVEVVGLVRNLPKAKMRFAHYADRKDFTFLKSDLGQPLPSGERFDFVVHGASHASPKYYFSDPVGTILPNVIGTHYLLERARADGTEAFLFISSGEVYGQVASDTVVTEEQYGYLDPTALRSCYAEAKRAGESMCVAAYHQYGVPTFIGRPFHTYGPGLAEDDGRVFSDFIFDIVARRDIVIKSDGSARRLFCYVSDAMRALFTIMLKGEPARPYNVSNDRAYVSIRELAGILCETFAERALKFSFEPLKAGAGYAKSPVLGYRPSVEALRSLGWDASVSIAEGFRRTVQSIEQERASSSR